LGLSCGFIQSLLGQGSSRAEVSAEDICGLRNCAGNLGMLEQVAGELRELGIVRVIWYARIRFSGELCGLGNCAGKFGMPE
jgi:hypothetical protein